MPAAVCSNKRSAGQWRLLGRTSPNRQFRKIHPDADCRFCYAANVGDAEILTRSRRSSRCISERNEGGQISPRSTRTQRVPFE
jgi:hypothetical protein